MLVLGSRMTALAGLDLRTVGMVFERNGAIVNTGAGAEVLGHPAAAVAWLANKLAEYGQSLGSGDIILSGALTAASEIAAGDVFYASFSTLGSVKAVFA
jgi:2-keto-4-pentenoate hydratase